MKVPVSSPKHSSTVAAREHFSVSRAMEYFSEAELVRQSGHMRDEWPLMLVKEGVENSLDGCESALISPKIEITVDEELLTVSDNGPGIPADVVRRICDFNSRTSDKSSYISPTRGQMGNGTKLLLAVPFVLNASRETITIIEACGVRHRISIEPPATPVEVGRWFYLAEGSGGAGHGGRVPEGARPRPSPGETSADYVCRAQGH
jgi:hypothetical protein